MVADITLVFGPPGTGKTTWLKDNAANMIAQDSGAAEEMLAVSFSNTAAQVLRSRMGIPQERAGTLHSLGRAYLEKAPIVDAPPARGEKKNVLVEEWNDWYPQWAMQFTGEREGTVDELGVSNGENAYGYREKMGNKLLDACNLFRHCLYPEESWPQAAGRMDMIVQNEILEFWKEWQRFKRRTGCIDFTDMIELPYRDRARVPFGAEVVYCDEAQDNTPLIMARVLQFAELMGDYGQLFVGLDDDQTIYGHLGCDPGPVLRLTDVGRIHLDQSYRMPRLIHEYSQGWIQKVSAREPKEFRPMPTDGEIEIGPYSLSRSDQGHIAALGEAVKREAYGEGRSVMLLASTNLMAGQIVATLRDYGIPFHNLNRPKNGQWNPLGNSSPTKGSTAAILSWAKPEYGQVWTVRDVARIADFIKTKGVFKNASALRSRVEKMEPRDLDEEIDDQFIRREFASIDAYGDLASGDIATLRGLLPTISGRLKGAYHLDILERFGRDGLVERPRVIVGTIHSVKGDEADTVFVFPDISNAAFRSIDSDVAQRDHVIRTFYVALSRARMKLVICQGQRGLPVIKLPDVKSHGRS